MSQKSVKQDSSARVAFNAIQHLLFAFLCSVRTLLLREHLQHAFGFVDSIRFLTHGKTWNLQLPTSYQELG